MDDLVDAFEKLDEQFPYPQYIMRIHEIKGYWYCVITEQNQTVVNVWDKTQIGVIRKALDVAKGDCDDGR